MYVALTRTPPPCPCPPFPSQMGKLMGQVFCAHSEVNLLGSVLDSPDFLWSAPDALQALYNKV